MHAHPRNVFFLFIVWFSLFLSHLPFQKLAWSRFLFEPSMSAITARSRWTMSDRMVTQNAIQMTPLHKRKTIHGTMWIQSKKETRRILIAFALYCNPSDVARNLGDWESSSRRSLRRTIKLSTRIIAVHTKLGITDRWEATLLVSRAGLEIAPCWEWCGFSSTFWHVTGT